MVDVSSMPEKDLKAKVNELRTQISHNERAVRSVFNELKLHRTNNDELKEKRDKLNSQVKELASKARELKGKRDEANAKIAELKTKRNELQTENQKVADEISGLKAKRDELNKLSRGSVESLSKAYASEIDTLLNADIPLKHEIDLFGKLLDLEGRLDAAYAANEAHRKVQEIYDSSMNVSSGGDVSKQIRELAQQSQEYHLEMLDSYKTVDQLRKEADMYHSQIRENYAVTAPLREKIDPLKEKISQLRDELNIYLEKLNDLQLAKDEKKKDEQHVVAREKLDKSGRLSLEDLKVLMEKGDIKF